LKFELEADDILENVATAQFIPTSTDGRRIYRKTEGIAAPPLLDHLPTISEDDDNIWPYDGLLEDENEKESSTDPPISGLPHNLINYSYNYR
jgi:hypothetical protein